MTSPLSLSVVVVTLVGGDALAATLRCLPEQNVERIVMLRGGDGDPEDWGRRFPATRFVQASADPVPLRRSEGAQQAHGDVIAFLEDTTCPRPGWCAAASSAFAEADVAAAGGPIRISPTLSSRCQALGWIEYGRFEPSRFPRLAAACPAPRASPFRVTRLPGNNMAYRRTALLEALQRSAGLVEGSICAALQAQGRHLLCHPGMEAEYAAADHHGAALRTRLSHGRLYAASQARERAWPERLRLLAKSALLPGVLLARTIAAVTGSVPLSRLASVSVWAALMESAWAVGEGLGAVAGAGNSLDAWR